MSPPSILRRSSLRHRGSKSPSLIHRSSLRRSLNRNFSDITMAPQGRTRSRVGSTDATSSSYLRSEPSPQSQHSVQPTTYTSTFDSSTTKRGRGQTRGLSLQELTRGGAKVSVTFPDGCLRPVGDNAKEFTTEVGILCRSLIPASTPRWADVTDDYKHHVYQGLEDKFIIDLSEPHMIYAINDMMKERLQEYRAELHRHYKRFSTHGEAVQHAPMGVTVEEWRSLCERFGSESFQKRSKINSKNRANLVVNHVSGSKSFIRHRHEMQNRETGEERSEVDHYRDVHYREQAGTWVHPLALERWEAMQLRRSQPTQDGSTEQSELEIMSEVLGTRSGYVRGLGHGAKLMAPSRSGRAVIEAELNRRNKENQHLRLQLEELRDEMRENRAAMEAEMMKRTKELRIHQERQERQMQEMFQSLAARLQIPGCSTAPQTCMASEKRIPQTTSLRKRRSMRLAKEASSTFIIPYVEEDVVNDPSNESEEEAQEVIIRHSPLPNVAANQHRAKQRRDRQELV
ncbi:hypothetical protein QJS10_CPB19g01994 [Acorus calamus]|uniref:Uncharacterized protein n=1 Tax=Acorus calamus TaxID=4465 RepID=A0AAV9CHI6_ACOCL|nr:hypothetical protein QJS10_CPB19g01994 [Acorus calamus]